LSNKTHVQVVFTDLDGTLLDDAYSFADVEAIIKQLKSLGVRIVASSSKTRTEIEYYREKLGLSDPFISENGAAIFIPKGYFKKAPYTGSVKLTARYRIIQLGCAYSAIREKFMHIRETCRCGLVGFGDMTIEELSANTGLPADLAKLAKQREYTEPFRKSDGHQEKLLNVIADEGLNCTKGGRYYHLTGNHDKGRAVSLLKEMYMQEYGAIETFSVGDQQNDEAMLKETDWPFLVSEKSGRKQIWQKIVQQVTKSK
jgi:mannosyl-3-phosphoglycerate phosphatase